MSDASTDENPWRRFWNRGGWWKALLAAVVYIALYLGASALVGTVFSGAIDRDDLLGTPISVFAGVTLPIIIGAVLLLVFAATLGWLPSLFRRHHGPAPRWMWIAVALVVIPAVLRLAGTDWGRLSVTLVLSVLFLGLCIGFAEELLTRGIAVELMRRGGHGERFVYLLSSLLFGILHATNAISGQPILTVLLTVVYAFGFGAMMYLSLRVTRWLFAVMLLHAATDPTTILAVGGIDQTTVGGSNPLISIAGVFGIVYVVFALVAIPFVKGRVDPVTVGPSNGVSGGTLEQL